MEMESYERRDELVAERSALIKSMRGVRTLFVATFADELVERWDWAVRAWLRCHEGDIEPEQLAASRDEVERLHVRAREIADVELSGASVWGHVASETEIARMRAYEPTGAGNRWTHLSPAIERAERRAIEVLEQRFGAGPSEIPDWNAGALSEPLAELLETYSESFARLQKVNKVLARLRETLPRPRPNLVEARLYSD